MKARRKLGPRIGRLVSAMTMPEGYLLVTVRIRRGWLGLAKRLMLGKFPNLKIEIEEKKV